MTLEELRKEEHEEDEKEESESEESEEESSSESEETNKSFDTALLETLSSLTEHVKSLSDRQTVIEDILEKAMEEPTDLALDVKVHDKEDVGDDVTVPEQPYPQGEQATLDADGKDQKPTDKKLEIQATIGKAQEIQKGQVFTTETPRPNAALDGINKSASSGVELNMVLKDARAEGYEGISRVAKRILAGDYGNPQEGLI